MRGEKKNFLERAYSLLLGSWHSHAKDNRGMRNIIVSRTM